MKYILCLLFVISAHASALELDVGIGYTKAEYPNNGHWYQKPFKHSIDDKSPSGHIGVKFDSGIDNLSVLVGYKYLGSFSSKALASSSDYNYAQYRRGDASIWPLATWKGRGKSHGLYLSGEYEINSFFVRAGVWASQSSWKMKISNWRPLATYNLHCDMTGPNEGDSSNCYGHRRQLNVKVDDGIQYSYNFAAGYKYKSILLAYELWHVKTPTKFSPTYRGLAHNVTLTYRFNL